MRVLQAETQEQFDRIEKLYLEAFPEAERKPLELIKEKQKNGLSDILFVEDDQEDFCGLAISMYKDDLVILDYFAIDSTKRCAGYGSKTFQKLLEHYAGKRFLIEIEDARIPSENQEERVRRENFYHRNNMSELGIQINLCGVEMILLTNNTPVTYEEYIGLYDYVYGKEITDTIQLISKN